jgi:Zn-dependent protease with chaperone function
LYHDKGRPRFTWKIHPDLRVLLVLGPAILVLLLLARPVIWKYIAALRQIRKERVEFLALIRKWRKELAKGYTEPSVVDPQDYTQWDRLIESLESSRASMKISTKLRLLSARTTLAYLIQMGCYITVCCGVAWGIWQLSPFSTLLPARFMDSIPCLIGMIAVVAFGGGWLVMLLYPFVIRGWDASVSIPLDPKRAPELHRLICATAKHFNAPVPHEIHISALPTASVARRRLFLRKKWRLTLGLPFLGSVTPRQLVAMIAHELGHTMQNRHIDMSIRTDGAGNGFIESFNRLAWIRSIPTTRFGAFCETLILVPIFMVFKAMAFASIYLSRKLSRELEFHADQQTACILSPEEHEQFMVMLGRSQLAMHLTFQELGEIYHLKILPDNLPKLIRHNDRTMPEQTPDALKKEISKQKTLWFDTHPSDTERTQAVRAIKPYPQPSLPNTFDKLDTAILIPNIGAAEALATIAHYRESIGEDYATDLLKPTDEIIERFKSRFDAMGALNRLLGRWPLPQLPLEIAEESCVAPDASFEQCSAQVQAYRKWRIDQTQRLGKSTETLKSLALDAVRLYFVELLNVAVPSLHTIANKHLSMSTKRATNAMAMRSKGRGVFDLYEDQHDRLNAYFQAITKLLADHEQKLDIPNIQTLRDQTAQNMQTLKALQPTQALLSSLRVKFGLLPELIQLVQGWQPPPRHTPNLIITDKLQTTYDCIGFVDGRITRMLCLMGQTARAILELKHIPDIAQMVPRLEKIAVLTFTTLDDYLENALDDTGWMLHCLDSIHRSALSELARAGQKVEEALGMDVSADNFASEQMQDQLAFHIV